MQTFHIRTHQPFREPLHKHAFYILNKGQNSGKPARTPWVNSFEISSDDSSIIDAYYWLVHALYTAKKFRSIQYGSCVETIRLYDVRKLIESYNVEALTPDFIDTLNNIDKMMDNLRDQLIKYNTLRIMIAESKLQSLSYKDF